MRITEVDFHIRSHCEGFVVGHFQPARSAEERADWAAAIQTRVYGSRILGGQVYKEPSLWQYRACRSPGTILTSAKRVPIPCQSERQTFGVGVIAVQCLGSTIRPWHVPKERF
jgi:hypothetical protein